jgi:DNA processing protein
MDDATHDTSQGPAAKAAPGAAGRTDSDGADRSRSLRDGGIDGRIDGREDAYRLLLAWFGETTSGLGALLRDFPDPLDALNAPEERLAELPRATQRRLTAAREACSSRGPGARAARRLRDLSRRVAVPRAHGPADDVFLPIGDGRYPVALRTTPDPPPWLFCRGDPHCLQGPAVAVVGSRKASHAGRAAATAIARYLAGAGYLVCSGLALGIDAAAHRGALDRGLTAAVLASGLDQASPRRNLPLAGEIAARGCLVTELPYGTPPSRERFPRRNRIISGLCGATVLVEAALPSGSLHTAAAALEQGRDIFVLPWSVYHENGRGCLQLLRDGATPLTDLDELPCLFPPVRQLQLPAVTGPASLPAAELGSDERLILGLVGDGILSAEDLQRGCAFPPQRLFAALTKLELDGLIECRDGLYRRCVASGLRGDRK